ncbi:MAG: S9 family peptidase [Gemmatimonadetes bacterium]|nr:S9 family peptidase [Gemmatimonadota bacterium]
MRIRTLALGALCVLAATAPLARAQQPRAKSLTVDQYMDWEDVQNPQLSPDGSQVIYTRRWVDKMNDKWESSLWIMNVDGTHARFLVNGSDVRWSPDGKRIAYVAKGEPGGSQLFTRWMDAEGAVSQLSHLTEAPANVEWAPDGKSIAFTMNVPSRTEWRIPMPTPPKGAKWVEPPKIVTRLNYRSDRIGYIDEGYRHVFTIPADGGTPRQVTDGDWNHGPASFSADGKTLVFSSLRIPDAEHAYRRSAIYAANLENGEITALTGSKGTNSNPVFSPDGKLIAYMYADSTDHSASPEARLWVMNADGSNARAISGTLDRPIAGLLWARDGSGVYFGVESEGSRNEYFASTSGALRAVTAGAQVLNVSDVSALGVAVAVRSTPTKPNDVVTFAVPKGGAPVTAFTQITAVNDDVLAGRALAQTEEVWYTSKDGMKIQGWIVKPAGFDKTKKYPLILDIHGGPQAMYNVAFSFARQDHASNGYVVLYTNPRGSTGYGIKFTNEIKNAYPGKDFDDLMAGVDTVIGRGYIDPKNLFVYGCSGGGVLTAWIVGHTDRFAAASSNCPVINWMSFVGETDGAGWYGNFEKPFWEDPSEHLRRSPIMYVGHVKTPTMLMTGVLDLRTPIPQTEEFYRALKLRGVPTAMIRMNNEFHGTGSTPSNFMRTQLYLHSWFEKWSTKPPRATTSHGGAMPAGGE